MAEYTLAMALRVNGNYCGVRCAAGCQRPLVALAGLSGNAAREAFLSVAAHAGWVVFDDRFVCPVCWECAKIRASLRGDRDGLRALADAARAMRELGKVTIVERTAA